jgi:hypothetical protein
MEKGGEEGGWVWDERERERDEGGGEAISCM